MRSFIALAACGLVLLLAGCREAAPAPSAAAQAKVATAQPTVIDTVTATATRAPTGTPAPTHTPTVTPMATASPTATPTPAPQTIRLTDGGCCTQPFWSADSAQVRFIDKPDQNAPVGIYGVSVAQPGSAPVLVSEQVEDSQAIGDYRVETARGSTAIVRLSDGERWTVPAAGRNVAFSPDGTRIAWAAVNDDGLPPENQVTTVWVADLDGSNARKVATLPRGGLSGWISNDGLLVNGRENGGQREQVLSVLSLADGTLAELARAERLRSPVLSPSGRWVAYYTTFTEDASQNGLWLVSTAGGPPRLLPSELFGAYQWRGGAEESLLIVPFRPEAEYHEFWEIRMADGAAHRLTDPAVTPFKIANGDWRVSPDGRYVAYVESQDRNIWVIELPQPK
jgi:Tol biopolymer transport system component